MNKIRNGSSKKPNSEHLWNQSVFCKYYVNCILCSTASNIFAQRWQISQLLDLVCYRTTIVITYIQYVWIINTPSEYIDHADKPCHNNSITIPSRFLILFLLWEKRLIFWTFPIGDSNFQKDFTVKMVC